MERVTQRECDGDGERESERERESENKTDVGRVGGRKEGGSASNVLSLSEATHRHLHQRTHVNVAGY